ncbi:MAG TPA: glycoside hydrolase family 15 protein [Steroidobacteraceae bacterium]|nr:glycoside hydrolase family 15 protein [Steroidobacteraceae bacterium]
MAKWIEDYALIGDCETAALVGRDGSIDWLCWPRFDSDACFAALLGTAEHGRWQIVPQATDVQVSRRYRGNTLILETRFATESGTVCIVDFMPPRDRRSDLVRIVVGERGEVAMRTELVLRFGYGIAVPWVTRIADDTWRAIAGPDMVVLRTPAPMHGENLKSVAEFTVKAGESVPFVLRYAPSHLPDVELADAQEALARTERFWLEWVDKGRRIARWPEQVTRSLITLRALIYAPTGGIVAAPTTSLPEQIGGTRNWDYRFCWLRDATLTLLALMDAGYYDEAVAWREWLLRAVAGSPGQAQIMYGVAGERRLSEWEVPWLPGYESSQPVRIGNGAHSQLQLDVYGEVMDALHQARSGGIERSEYAWAVQRELLEHLERIWEQPDCGLWEVRGRPQHFTHSKIMAWVAFDRGIKDAEAYGFKCHLGRWREIRARIHAQICERGFDKDRNCFVQAYGSHQLDASLLQIAELGFLPPDDPRVIGTISAIEQRLVRDGFVLRYDTEGTDDGLPPGEGAFIACSFWLVNAYAMTGRHEEAVELFERLTALANDVGLLAEEYDPHARRLVGNFPQGFSHLSLIVTAFNLAHSDKPAQQRAKDGR